MTPLSIIKKVARKYGLTFLSITGKSRTRWILRARKESYEKLIELGMTAPDIGRLFGKNHTTIYNALGRLNKKKK